MRRMIGGLAMAMSVLGLSACGGGSTEEFCAFEAEMNFDETNLDDLEASLDEAVDAAPDENKDDVEIVRSTFEEVSERLRDQDISDLADVTEEQREAMADLNTEEFQRANENIDQFVKANCPGN